MDTSTLAHHTPLFTYATADLISWVWEVNASLDGAKATGSAAEGNNDQDTAHATRQDSEKEDKIDRLMVEHRAAGHRARTAAALAAEKVTPKVANAAATSRDGAAQKLAALKAEKERTEERIQALMAEHQEAGRRARVAAAVAVAKKGRTTPSEEEKPIEEDGVVITM